MLRILNTCIGISTVPEDWNIVCIISVYKVKEGDRNKWETHWGVSILNIPGRVYGMILIGRIAERTKEGNREGRN